MQIALDGNAVVDRLFQFGERCRYQTSAHRVIFAVDAMFGYDDRDLGDRMGIPDGIGERVRIDTFARSVPVTRRMSLGFALGVPENSLIILDPEKIVAAYRLKPGSIGACANLITNAVGADWLIVRYRQRDADGKIASRSLDRRVPPCGPRSDFC